MSGGEALLRLAQRLPDERIEGVSRHPPGYGDRCRRAQWASAAGGLIFHSSIFKKNVLFMGSMVYKNMLLKNS